MGEERKESREVNEVRTRVETGEERRGRGEMRRGKEWGEVRWRCKQRE